MSNYTPPRRDIRFALHELAGLADIAALPGYEDATPDVVDSVVEEAGKFVPFLHLLGIVAGGWQIARAALVARRRGGLSQCVMRGGASVMALPQEQF
jgi:hypothetical protein